MMVNGSKTNLLKATTCRLRSESIMRAKQNKTQPIVSSKVAYSWILSSWALGSIVSPQALVSDGAVGSCLDAMSMGTAMLPPSDVLLAILPCQLPEAMLLSELPFSRVHGPVGEGV